MKRSLPAQEELHGTTLGVGDAPARRPPRASGWAIVVWVGTSVYATLLSAETLHRHRTFGSVFDVAIYDQRLWLLSQGREAFSTIVSKPFLGDHFEPGLVLLTPLYWVGSGIEGLLVAQTVGIALVAPALYALGRAAGATPPEASLPALLWLACAAVATVNLFGVRPAAFVSVLLVLSVLAALRDRHVLLFATAALALSLKEDVALTYLVLGLLLAYLGRRRVGSVLAAGSLVVFLVGMMTIESRSEQLEWQSRRFAGERGDSLVDVLVYMAKHPLESTGDVLARGGPGLAVLLVSTAGVALLAPVWTILALPTVSFNAISAYAPQHELSFHYHQVTVTTLFIAAAVGSARLGTIGRKGKAVVAVGVPCAVVLSVLGAQVTHRIEPTRTTSERAAIRAALDRIPGEASVSASPDFLPYLSRRVDVYAFPEPFVRIDWGSDLASGDLQRRAEGVSFVLLNGSSTPLEYLEPIAPIRAKLLRSGFVVSFRSGTVEVLTRG